MATGYANNGRVIHVTDGENNRTSYAYDGHDRLRRTYFPLAAQGANASNAADYEEYGYDAGGNRTGFYNRAGQTILFAYDALGRQTVIDRPAGEEDVTFGYDLLGRLTSASLPGHPLGFTYDALGRQLTQTSPRGTYASAYDLAGRRTRLTHPDGFFVQQSWLVTGELSQINEWNPSTGGVGYVIASFAYDIHGRRTSLTRGNGTVTSYSYDAASRLSQLAQDVSGTTHDLTLGFAYNPAGQIVTNTRSNDLFSVTPAAGTQTIPVNGLNQVATVNGLPAAHDARGNMTNDGAGGSFAYRSDNAMTGAAGIALYYDPLGRLVQVTGAPVTRFTYDGGNMVAQWDGADNFQRRYVYAGGQPAPAEAGEPLMQYEGPGISDRRYFHADERGSIVATSDSNAAVTAVNRYDEYGAPASANTGRFQYTGQPWIGEIGLYYYRARMYNPLRGGRFMQTDPIGYGDGMNMYAYVRGDPVNATDPSGLRSKTCDFTDIGADTIPVCGRRDEPVPTLGSGGNDPVIAGCPEMSIRVIFCNGGEGGGGSSGSSEETGDEDPGCRALRENAERERAGLRWFNNDNWNNVRLLTAYRDQFQRDADSLEWADDLSTALGLSLAGGAAERYFRPGALRGGLAGVTGTFLLWNAGVRLENSRAQVRALNARLQYLATCGSNTGG